MSVNSIKFNNSNPEEAVISKLSPEEVRLQEIGKELEENRNDKEVDRLRKQLKFLQGELEELKNTPSNNRKKDAQERIQQLTVETTTVRENLQKAQNMTNEQIETEKRLNIEKKQLLDKILKEKEAAEKEVNRLTRIFNRILESKTPDKDKEIEQTAGLN
ncbi:MAG: hypothetical protein WCO84_04475 [bacterium]